MKQKSFSKKNENSPRQKFPKYSYENKNSYRIHLILRFEAEICPIESDIITQTKNVPLIRPLLIRQTIVAFITAKGGNKYRQVNQTDFTGEGSNNKPHVETSLSKIQTRVYARVRTCSGIHTRVYRSVIDRIALKSITIPPRPFDNEANAVHDLVHEPLHEEDSRQSNDTTVSAAFVLDLACICPLDIHTVGYTRPFHIAVSRVRVYARIRVHEAAKWVTCTLDSCRPVSNRRNNLPLYGRG